jgi:hypothetical protein
MQNGAGVEADLSNIQQPADAGRMIAIIPASRSGANDRAGILSEIGRKRASRHPGPRLAASRHPGFPSPAGDDLMASAIDPSQLLRDLRPDPLRQRRA